MASFRQRGQALLQNRTLWRIALALSLVAIVILATMDTRYPMPSTPSDKLNHLIAFLELTILTRLAWPELRAFWYVPALLLFGLAIELVQATLPYRDFSLKDLLADGLGIAIGLLPWPGLPRAGKVDLRNSPESL
ncbi:VanZ family protein [Marinobacter pelagius]|uniref:VanZ family protein n=1 Tax=Marinobacter sp. C7 TaxID=2951363 RepID=UPI001EF12C3B|nr:VanZ family protein [Marinobacter sp. C7]MCG7198163.1 VanZ family protein [Marinobacter sp. C7]